MDWTNIFGWWGAALLEGGVYFTIAILGGRLLERGDYLKIL